MTLLMMMVIMTLTMMTKLDNDDDWWWCMHWYIVNMHELCKIGPTLAMDGGG